MALRLEKAGADGLVLFNRFMQTDINPDTFTISTGFKLSSPAEATLPRSWIARLRGQLHSSLAASTGVETADDVAAYLLAERDPRAARPRPGHPPAWLRAVRLPARRRAGDQGLFPLVGPGARNELLAPADRDGYPFT